MAGECSGCSGFRIQNRFRSFQVLVISGPQGFQGERGGSLPQNVASKKGVQLRSDSGD